MSSNDFFLAEARARVSTTIAEIEKETAAEVVVTVRRRSGHYRPTDLYVGSLFAFLTLIVLLFDEKEYAVERMPVYVLLAFALGFFGSANIVTLRRLLTSRKLMRQNTRTAARAAFYDLGVGRTRGRTGILVYVSIFERRVELVPDIGVKPEALGPEWGAAEDALLAALRPLPDLEGFLAAMRRLAAPLARALPAQEGDTDELPNEPVME